VEIARFEPPVRTAADTGRAQPVSFDGARGIGLRHRAPSAEIGAESENGFRGVVMTL
jgi:hypothetical protein